MTFTSRTIADSTQTLVSALKQSFERFGPSVAIDSPECQLTYAELGDLTAQLAAELRERFSSRQLKSEPVAILMSRSVEFYVAQIAVMRAGGFFLPIDPAQPSERIEFLLSDSQASLVLVREDDSFTAPSTSVNSLPVNVCRWKESFKVEQSGPLKATTQCLGKVSQTDLAYMIYTSGSSGQPKGVPIAHRGIWNLCHWWLEEFRIAHGERTLQLMSVGFDASLEEIYPAFATGGTLVPVQPEALNSMERFLDFVKQNQINKMHLPTAFFHTLAASLEAHRSLELPACIQTVVFGGEKADATLVATWFSRVNADIRLINAYGPTEATVVSSYAVLRPNDQPSIGKPIRGINYSIVGKDGELVEAGQPGELYISGVGVASEYWRRDQLSAEKFVTNPLVADQICYRSGDLVRLGSQGNYEFVGRVDNQIKLRGYRIEPDEISNCMASHPRVGQAYVVARQLSKSNKAPSLIGYVVSKSNEELDERDLTEFLQQRLPAYMVPVAIVQMESFPVTPGGKLDLDRFPIPASNQVSAADQGGDCRLLTETEQKVSEVWKEILGGDRLEREANFFQIGGDSLLAMRLVLLLESKFPGPVIPVAALIPNPTIASMAHYIDQRENGSDKVVSKNWPLLTRLGDSGKPINVVGIHAAGGGGMFYRQLFEGLEDSVQFAVLESATLFEDGPVVCERQSIAELARDYVDCLIDAGCEHQITLVGYSFGGLMAFEMAQLLKLKGFEVKRIINIDSAIPKATTPLGYLSRQRRRFDSPGGLKQRLSEFKIILQRKRQIKIIKERKLAGQMPLVELRPLALELEFSKLAEFYVPEPCDVSMHLIRGAELEPRYIKPDDYGWTEYVSELVVTKIPGGHHSIFSDPYLGNLKVAFQESLAD